MIEYLLSDSIAYLITKATWFHLEIREIYLSFVDWNRISFYDRMVELSKAGSFTTTPSGPHRARPILHQVEIWKICGLFSCGTGIKCWLGGS